MIKTWIKPVPAIWIRNEMNELLIKTNPSMIEMD